jgi:lactate dehydrogenase-like 2-hydroxyacid dehydrogenase
VKKINDVLRIGEAEEIFDSELAARYEIPRLPDGPGRAEFLAEHAADIRVVLTWGKPGVDADTIASLPNLEVIVNNGAGVDAIDLAAAKRRGIGVSNTPDVLSDTVADTALGLILMTLRGFGAADRYVRAGRWVREGPFPYGRDARDVSGLQVGILGLGRIGSAIATRLLGFDCAIAYHNRHRVDGSPYRYAESPVELAESVDVLVVATTGDTRHLVDRAVLEALGPEGYLVNIARGSVVDQDALVELLPATDSGERGWTSSPTSRMCPPSCSNWTTWCCFRTSAARRPEPAGRWRCSRSAISRATCAPVSR